MKKLVFLTSLLLTSTLMCNAGKFIEIQLEEGYGEVGVVGKGAFIGGNTQVNDQLAWGVAGLYDVARVNGKLGAMAGFEQTVCSNYCFTDSLGNPYIGTRRNNYFKVGLRAYRFITLGMLIGGGGKVGVFGGAAIPFKYLALGVEGSWYGQNQDWSLGITVGFTIPTKVKK